MSQLPLGVINERRRSSRRRITVPCQAVADYDFCLLGDEIADLSEKGLLLRSDGTPAEVGETVLVSFRPPGSTQWVDAEAKVVRLITGNAPGAPGLGLELLELPPFERGLLAGALELAERPRERSRPVIQVRHRSFGSKVVERPMVMLGPTHPPTVKGVARVVYIG